MKRKNAEWKGSAHGNITAILVLVLVLVIALIARHGTTDNLSGFDQVVEHICRIL
jgi:hypothetical protein